MKYFYILIFFIINCINNTNSSKSIKHLKAPKIENAYVNASSKELIVRWEKVEYADNYSIKILDYKGKIFVDENLTTDNYTKLIQIKNNSAENTYYIVELTASKGQIKSSNLYGAENKSDYERAYVVNEIQDSKLLDSFLFKNNVDLNNNIRLKLLTIPNINKFLEVENKKDNSLFISFLKILSKNKLELCPIETYNSKSLEKCFEIEEKINEEVRKLDNFEIFKHFATILENIKKAHLYEEVIKKYNKDDYDLTIFSFIRLLFNLFNIELTSFEKFNKELYLEFKKIFMHTYNYSKYPKNTEFIWKENLKKIYYLLKKSQADKATQELSIILFFERCNDNCFSGNFIGFNYIMRNLYIKTFNIDIDNFEYFIENALVNLRYILLENIVSNSLPNELYIAENSMYQLDALKLYGNKLKIPNFIFKSKLMEGIKFDQWILDAEGKSFFDEIATKTREGNSKYMNGKNVVNKFKKEYNKDFVIKELKSSLNSTENKNNLVYYNSLNQYILEELNYSEEMASFLREYFFETESKEVTDILIKSLLLKMGILINNEKVN